MGMVPDLYNILQRGSATQLLVACNVAEPLIVVFRTVNTRKPIPGASWLHSEDEPTERQSARAQKSRQDAILKKDPLRYQQHQNRPLLAHLSAMEFLFFLAKARRQPKSPENAAE
jgi:hypothetical protein